KKNRFTFITIGRLESQKNHKLLINAIKNINANLWIIGDGHLKKELEDMIKNLKLQDKVKLLGRQSNPYKFLAKADAFVFSSNYEGFPNVLLEALACELPIISTDCKSGPREILAPNSDFTKQTTDIEIAEFGILVPVGDVKRMADAMKIIIEDENLRNRLRKKALNRAKDFEVDKIIKEWEEIIEKVYKETKCK
ncbi:MAG TPA: glycosyltransferase, partial [Nautiliaceae bacterium]|nr:glycosyltransferase [Nautiliaceae bacterium]